MITLKKYFSRGKKEDIYKYYVKINKNIKDYNKITRNDIYNNIISLYINDPEIILKLCTMEEINILKKLVNNNIPVKNNGYIEYLFFSNLKNNYLVLEDNNEYYIPKDILNYIKMALNILNEKEYSLKDITDSVFIGLLRIYNVLELEELSELLSRYYISINLTDLKMYIEENPKLNNLIAIVKYKKKDYVVSLENFYYKDVLTLKRNDIKTKNYVLEEVISIGKYKINLFKEGIFKFLSFLEMHLESKYIDIIINDLIVYTGFDVNDELALKKIADNIEELFKELKNVVVYFPIWIYKGNDLISFKSNFILPDKNDLCLCGSGKKFKRCCMKKYK